MRMRNFGLIVGVGLTIATSARAGEPTAADLIKLVPSIRSSDPKVKSIEIVGSMKSEGFHLHFRALYRAPDQHAVLYCDGSDNTPLVFIADRQALYYDPIRPSVAFLKDCSEHVLVESNGERIRCLCGFLLNTVNSDNKGNDSDRINLNIKSLCEDKRLAKRVVRMGQTQFRLYLTSTEPAVISVCSFDTSKAQPFEGLKVFEGANHEPMFSVEKLVVNGPLADEEFRFPDRAKLAAKIKVRDSVGEGSQWERDETIHILNCMTARFGATRPDLRRKVKAREFRKLDWDAIRENDQKYSAVLRELLPIDRPWVLPELPKTASVPVENVVGPPFR